MTTTEQNLQLAAMNRHRVRLFGASSLKAYTTTPEAGEVLAVTFAVDWFGQRIKATTATDSAGSDSGAWQFQVTAKSDWATSQSFMLKIASLTIDARRWKVKKVEKPIGSSLVWKIKAEIQ